MYPFNVTESMRRQSVIGGRCKSRTACGIISLVVLVARGGSVTVLVTASRRLLPLERDQSRNRLPRLLDHRLQLGVGVAPVLDEVLV